MAYATACEQIEENYDYYSRLAPAGRLKDFSSYNTRDPWPVGHQGVANNAGGTFSIQKDALQSHKDAGLTAQIGVGSITEWAAFRWPWTGRQLHSAAGE